MAWGIGKRESDERFDARMKARDVWINEMWKAYRVNLGRERDGFWHSKEDPVSTDKCYGTGRHPSNPDVVSRGYGAVHNKEGFDRFKWKGTSYEREDAYCLDCDEKVSSGVGFSPWRSAAYEAWFKTRYMKQSNRDRFLKETAKTIKFGRLGKRRVLKMNDGEHAYEFLERRGFQDDYGNPMWFGRQ